MPRIHCVHWQSQGSTEEGGGRWIQQALWPVGLAEIASYR